MRPFFVTQTGIWTFCFSYSTRPIITINHKWGPINFNFLLSTIHTHTDTSIIFMIMWERWNKWIAVFNSKIIFFFEYLINFVQKFNKDGQKIIFNENRTRLELISKQQISATLNRLSVYLTCSWLNKF